VVRIKLEVSGSESPFKVLVWADSIRRAEDIVRSRYPGKEVRVVFPIDGDGFFADDDGREWAEPGGTVVAT